MEPVLEGAAVRPVDRFEGDGPGVADAREPLRHRCERRRELAGSELADPKVGGRHVGDHVLDVQVSERGPVAEGLNPERGGRLAREHAVGGVPEHLEVLRSDLVDQAPAGRGRADRAPVPGLDHQRHPFAFGHFDGREHQRLEARPRSVGDVPLVRSVLAEEDHLPAPGHDPNDIAVEAVGEVDAARQLVEMSAVLVSSGLGLAYEEPAEDVPGDARDRHPGLAYEADDPPRLVLVEVADLPLPHELELDLVQPRLARDPERVGEVTADSVGDDAETTHGSLLHTHRCALRVGPGEPIRKEPVPDRNGPNGGRIGSLPPGPSRVSASGPAAAGDPRSRYDRPHGSGDPETV